MKIYDSSVVNPGDLPKKSPSTAYLTKAYTAKLFPGNH